VKCARLVAIAAEALVRSSTLAVAADARLNADETPPSNTSPPSSNPTSRLHLAAGQQFINSSLSL